MDIVDRLRGGVIEHEKRWSGDTHDDLGGSADYDKTDALMDEAASEIERLRGWVKAMGGLSDVNADHRGTMANLALSGTPASEAKRLDQ